MKPFKYSGVWWLPSREDQKIAGEVAFGGDEQTKLVIHGIFEYDFKSARIELPWYSIILGTVEADQPITLLHCQAISSSSGIGTEREQIGEQEYSITDTKNPSMK